MGQEKSSASAKEVISEQCQRVVYESEFSNENAFNSQVKFLRHC